MEGAGHCLSAPCHLFGGTNPCLVPPQDSCCEIWGLKVSVPLSVGNLAQQVSQEGPRALQVAQQGDGFFGRRGEGWFPVDIPSYALGSLGTAFPLC